MDYITASRYSARFLHVVGGNGENRAAIHSARRDQADTFGGFLASGRFCHANNIKGKCSLRLSEAQSLLCYAAGHAQKAESGDCRGRESGDGARGLLAAIGVRVRGSDRAVSRCVNKESAR